MTQITVKYLNPRDGNRPPSIKGEDGKFYTIPDDKYHLYRVGQTFDAPVNSVPAKKPDRNGNPAVFHRIADWFDPTGSNGTNVAPPAQPPAAPPSPPPTNWQRPAPPQANGSARLLDAKDVQITTIALMKSFIETGKFGLTDLPMLEQACIPSAKRICGGSQ